MDKLKFILRLVREVGGYLILGSIVLSTLFLMAQHSDLNGAVGGALLTGGLSGIVAIALNQKEPKEPKKEKS